MSIRHACQADSAAPTQRSPPPRWRVRLKAHQLEARPTPAAADTKPSRHPLVFPTGLLENARGKDRRNATQRAHLLPRRRSNHDRRIQRRSPTTPGLVPQPPRTPRRHVRRNADGRSCRRRRDRTRSTVEPGRPNLSGLRDIPTRRGQGRSNNPDHPAHTQRAVAPSLNQPPQPGGCGERRTPTLGRRSRSNSPARASPADCRPLEHSRTTAPNCPPPMDRQMPVNTPTASRPATLPASGRPRRCGRRSPPRRTRPARSRRR